MEAPVKKLLRLPGRSAAALAALGLSAAVLAGCAGNPPTEQFAVANAVITSAESAGAQQYANTELQMARDKLQRAQMLLDDEQYDEARRLAEQAQWDARVAERKAQAAKAEKADADAREAIQDIRNEGQRSLIVQ